MWGFRVEGSRLGLRVPGAISGESQHANMSEMVRDLHEAKRTGFMCMYFYVYRVRFGDKVTCCAKVTVDVLYLGVFLSFYNISPVQIPSPCMI